MDNLNENQLRQTLERMARPGQWSEWFTEHFDNLVARRGDMIGQVILFVIGEVHRRYGVMVSYSTFQSWRRLPDVEPRLHQAILVALVLLDELERKDA